MIHYLKKTLPDRFVFLLLVLLAFRLTYLIKGIPLLNDELKWLVTGERLADGWMLYRDNWTEMAPLSALIYDLMDFFFGRSPLAYHIISMLLVLTQAMQFQYLTKKPVYSEKTLIPAFLYILFCNLFLDFYTISPVLLSLSFLIPALGKALDHIEHPISDEGLFSIGFLTGMAALFYPPALLFLFCILFGLAVLASINLRKIFLVLFGFVFVLGGVVIFFYLNGALNEFYLCLIKSISIENIPFDNLKTMFFIFIPVLLILLAGILRSLSGNLRLINYQLRCTQFVFFWFIISLATIILNEGIVPYLGMVLLLPACYFGTHFFLSFRSRFYSETLGACLVLAILFTSIMSLTSYFGKKDFFKVEKLIVDRAKTHPEITGKRILILGENQQDYINNAQATPYQNQTLSQRHFANMDNYLSVTELYENFRKDPPDVIIDPEGKIKPVFIRIPALASQYHPHPKWKNVYLKIIPQK